MPFGLPALVKVTVDLLKGLADSVPFVLASTEFQELERNLVGHGRAVQDSLHVDSVFFY